MGEGLQGLQPSDSQVVFKLEGPSGNEAFGFGSLGGLSSFCGAQGRGWHGLGSCRAGISSALKARSGKPLALEFPGLRGRKDFGSRLSTHEGVVKGFKGGFRRFRKPFGRGFLKDLNRTPVPKAAFLNIILHWVQG